MTIQNAQTQHARDLRTAAIREFFSIIIRSIRERGSSTSFARA